MMEHQHDLPDVHDLLHDFRKLIDGYDDRVLVGETEDIAYYGNGQDELHMVFNFRLMNSGHLRPAFIRANQQERLAALPPGAWPCNTLGNHDQSRVFNRFGDGKHDHQLARLSLALMLTLRGTPFLYNGEEIGMTDYLVSDLSQFKDFIGLWMYDSEIAAGVTPEQAFEHAVRYARDKCRTPMQWGTGPNAGFSPNGIQTWLPVNPNYADGVNVESQLADPVSLLNFYRRLLAVRKQTPALLAGDYREHDAGENVFAFYRQTDSQTCAVALNFSAEPQRLALPNGSGKILFSSATRSAAITASVELQPFEICIVEL